MFSLSCLFGVLNASYIRMSISFPGSEKFYIYDSLFFLLVFKKVSQPLGDSSLNAIMGRPDIFKVSYILWDSYSHFLIILSLSFLDCSISSTVSSSSDPHLDPFYC